MSKICMCKWYDIKDFELVHESERCKKSDVMKVITSLLVRGHDEYLTPHHILRVVGKDKWGDTHDFELWEDEIDRILGGDDEFRKEVRREYRDFIRDKEIVAVEFYDPYFECCWGDEEYCEDALGGD